MKRKLSAAVLILMLIACVFTCCNESVPEEATQISGNEPIDIKEELSLIEEHLSSTESAKSTENSTEFTSLLKDPDVASVSYFGTEDITIKHTDNTEKTIAVSTTGSLTLNSEVEALVVNAADNGFTAKAKADSLILKGNNITAEIRSETGSIYVEGKDIILDIKNGDISKILVRNNTAIINNRSRSTVFITLTNGAQVQLDAGFTYKVKENTIQKYSPAE